MVGVNRFALRRRGAPTSRCASTRRSRPQQAERLARAARGRATTPRSTGTWTRCATAAAGTDNVLYPMQEALRARATVGEVCNALREVWGVYHPRRRLLSRPVPDGSEVAHA